MTNEEAIKWLEKVRERAIDIIIKAYDSKVAVNILHAINDRNACTIAVAAIDKLIKGEREFATILASASDETDLRCSNCGVRFNEIKIALPVKETTND